MAIKRINSSARDSARVAIVKCEPRRDRMIPAWIELIMRAVAQRFTWGTEYDKALLADGTPGQKQTSATGQKGQRP